MEYSSRTGDPASIKTQCLVIGLTSGNKPDETFDALNNASGGQLGRILRKNDFRSDQGTTLLLYEVPGVAAARVMLLGLGERRTLASRQLASAVGSAVGQLNTGQTTEAVFVLPTMDDSRQAIRDAVLAAEEAVYRFDQCKSDPQPPRKPLRKISFHAPDRRLAKAYDTAATQGIAIAGGVSLAKDLSNLPGNICTPSYLAEEARRIGRRSPKLKVSVLEEKDMQKLGMGALLSVSRGSRQPAKLIVMEYKGAGTDSKPIALVGKGLTFDAGGISIKPAADMDQMKYDMCGGASVLGALNACVDMQLPINVVGVVPSSENLPDGDANKPGDIVTSMSGQTIEVLNTDAEGRLILCDALTYTERFEPSAVIDIATLTGACIIALGHHASGLLANDDKLADALLDAGEACGDRAWRLPLWDDYQKSLDSNFADMANIGGRSGGTITAACFLSRYTRSFKWAHLDIAGTAWKTGAEKGATGRPVPMLMHFLMTKAKISV